MDPAGARDPHPGQCLVAQAGRLHLLTSTSRRGLDPAQSGADGHRLSQARSRVPRQPEEDLGPGQHGSPTVVLILCPPERLQAPVVTGEAGRRQQIGLMENFEAVIHRSDGLHQVGLQRSGDNHHPVFAGGALTRLAPLWRWPHRRDSRLGLFDWLGWAYSSAGTTLSRRPVILCG